jgi:hypothetical protein
MVTERPPCYCPARSCPHEDGAREAKGISQSDRRARDRQRGPPDPAAGRFPFIQSEMTADSQC